MGRRPASGFTLIELMVVVAILAIITTAAAPSFRSFLEGQRVKGMAYDLTADLMLARSEALKRNASVSIVRSGDDWGQGWTTATVAVPAVISIRNASLGVLVSDAPASITFDVNGRVSSPSTEVRMTLSGSSGGTSRCVEISPSGRARSSIGACT
jgi:type IV fimbrial biogenesis protein FimT